MMCQLCGARPATTHLKKTSGGKTTALHICSQCAAEQGLHLLDSFGLGMDDFWGHLFAAPAASAAAPAADAVRCQGCGHSFAEIAETGRVGCPQCYATFYDQLLPSIQRLHGKAVHAGKIPDNADDEQQRRKREKEQLQEQLHAALEKQDYETCATLRDRIKALEGAEEA